MKKGFLSKKNAMGQGPETCRRGACRASGRETVSSVIKASSWRPPLLQLQVPTPAFVLVLWLLTLLSWWCSGFDSAFVMVLWL